MMRSIVFCLIGFFILSLALPTLTQAHGVKIVLTPTSGPVGTTVTARITTDTHNSPFAIFWKDLSTPPLREGRTILDSRHATVTFTVPEAAKGEHVVYLWDGATRSKTSAFFKVTPSLAVTPASVTTGATVTVIGRGFAASDTVEITFDNSPIKSEISASALGSFTTAITIPKAIAGSHVFRAFGKNTPEDDVPPFSITIIPSLAVSPTPAEAGKEITLKGNGFASNSVITIKYNKQVIETKPSPLKSDASGSFSATFILPLSITGKSLLQASDTAGNSVNLELALEKTPPPHPTPVSPVGGTLSWFGGESVTFEWTSVTDPSGVTYTLEIAKNLQFFPPYLRRSGLTEVKYTAELEPGTYYWRVRATDGAGNHSPWALAPHPLQVGFFPLWSLLLAGAIGTIVVLWLIIRLSIGFYNWLKGMFY